MRKLMMVAVIGMVLCAGCIPLMHSTVARQVIRVDKNCQVLLSNYKALLTEGAQPEDPEHDVALAEATMVLTDDLRQTAELMLGEKKGEPKEEKPVEEKEEKPVEEKEETPEVPVKD